MVKGYEITTYQKSLIIRLRMRGLSYRDISDVTAIPKSTLGDLIKKFHETGDFCNKARPSHPIVTKGNRTHDLQVILATPYTTTPNG